LILFAGIKLAEPSFKVTVFDGSKSMNGARQGAGIGLLAFVAICGVGLAAHAALLTTDPGAGTTTVFTGSGSIASPGPVTLDGFVWTGNPAVVSDNGRYGVGANGAWSPSGEFWWIATYGVTTPDGVSSITVNLGGNFGLVGGFMNYALDFGADATITALAADGVTAVQSYDLVTNAPITTPGGTDAGAFRGISSPLDNIHYLELSGGFILLHTLEIGQAAGVPESGTLTLLGFSLAAFGLLRRRKV
jgi:hypothetical protein